MAGRVLSPLGRITRTARAGGRLRPVPADRAGRPGRRAEGARRHLRRDAGPAGAGLHRPAAVRRATPRTSCAPRWRSTARCWRCSSPTRGRRRSSSSSARRCWPPTSAASSWSRACCCSPAATTRSSSASRWTWPRSPRRRVDQARGEAEAKGVEIRGERGARGRPGQRRPAGADRAEPGAERRALQRAGGRLGGGHHRGPSTARRCWWCRTPVRWFPAYEIDNLFEPFRRLRTERTGSDKGVGLGLSIARSVARAHGGRIIARAARGRWPRDARHPARSEMHAPDGRRRVLFALRGIFGVLLGADSCVIDHTGEFPAIYSP